MSSLYANVYLAEFIIWFSSFCRPFFVCNVETKLTATVSSICYDDFDHKNLVFELDSPPRIIATSSLCTAVVGKYTIYISIDGVSRVTA